MRCNECTVQSMGAIVVVIYSSTCDHSWDVGGARCFLPPLHYFEIFCILSSFFTLLTKNSK
jgi:hypothetical protein